MVSRTTYITRQMHKIEGASLSEARGVPDICWAPKDACIGGPRIEGESLAIASRSCRGHQKIK